MPKSTPARIAVPISCLWLALLSLPSAPLAAQGADRIVADVDVHKEPGGTRLGRVVRGAAVTFGATRDGWREITILGWVPATALRNDARDGFDVAVALAAGVPLRTSPSADAQARGTAVAGTLFDRMESRSGWVLVRRTAWINPAAAAPPTAPPPPPPAAVAPVADSTPARSDSGVALLAGAPLSASRGGPVRGRMEVATPVELVERREGWSRVRIDAWVPDASLGGAAAAGGVTAAQLRNDPDGYTGQTVEWRLQVLAVREADDLRPELPRGQAYVLARGPLPETGFVYLLVNAADAATFRGMEPLAEVLVRATIRAGRTRFLPTPVLDLVRRLD